MIILTIGQALLPLLTLRQKGLVTATSGLPPLRDFHFTEFARQTFPSGLTPAVKDCFGLHGHYAFGSVAKEKSGVGRKSATSVGLTTDLVHWLQAGKTVDFLRCASEINRLFPSSALSIFRINRNSFHIILAVSNNCRIFATRISATPLIQAYQGGTFFYRCYAVHQSTADHSGSDFTSSEQRTHNKRCRKGRVRIEKYQLLPLG